MVCAVHMEEGTHSRQMVVCLCEDGHVGWMWLFKFVGFARACASVVWRFLRECGKGVLTGHGGGHGFFSEGIGGIMQHRVGGGGVLQI